jgi:uncharacterized membrane protein YkoI
MTPPLSPLLVFLALGLFVVSATAPGRADSRKHDLVRRAVESGEIRPLSDIQRDVRDKLPGEIVGVEAERKNGRWQYEFRVVDGRGRLFDVYVDAQTGEIGTVKEK